MKKKMDEKCGNLFCLILDHKAKIEPFVTKYAETRLLEDTEISPELQRTLEQMIVDQLNSMDSQIKQTIIENVSGLDQEYFWAYLVGLEHANNPEDRIHAGRWRFWFLAVNNAIKTFQ